MTTEHTLQMIVVACMLLLCGGLVGASGEMEEEDEKERQIRAAFVLNCVRFTTWPQEAFDSASSPIVLSVVGSDPFGRVLEQTFSREHVQGRPFALRRISVPRRSEVRTDGEHAEAMTRMRNEIRTSHILYLTVCESSDLHSVLQGVDTAMVLTVGDRRTCAERGTALAIDRAGDKLTIYANMSEIESLNLRISSKLLALATIVQASETRR